MFFFFFFYNNVALKNQKLRCTKCPKIVFKICQIKCSPVIRYALPIRYYLYCPCCKIINISFIKEFSFLEIYVLVMGSINSVLKTSIHVDFSVSPKFHLIWKGQKSKVWLTIQKFPLLINFLHKQKIYCRYIPRGMLARIYSWHVK